MHTALPSPEQTGCLLWDLDNGKSIIYRQIKADISTAETQLVLSAIDCCLCFHPALLDIQDTPLSIKGLLAKELMLFAGSTVICVKKDCSVLSCVSHN